MKKFTTPCFIRRNSKELRRYLEMLGYKNRFEFVGGDSICAINSKKDQYMTYNSTDGFMSYYEKNFCRVDCGTNEELFKAIAALREGSDSHQWFVWNTETDNGDKWRIYDANPNWNWWKFECHKATEKELIEHFK